MSALCAVAYKMHSNCSDMLLYNMLEISLFSLLLLSVGGFFYWQLALDSEVTALMRKH
jgi:hypothetical protein